MAGDSSFGIQTGFWELHFLSVLQIQKIGIALSSIGHRVTLLQAVSTDRGALSLVMFINSIVILFLVTVFRDLPL